MADAGERLVGSALASRLAEIIDRLWRRSVYLLIGFPLGIASFVVVVTGLSTGLGTIITFVGLPILVGTLLAARLFAMVERGLLSGLLGRDVPPLAYRRSAPGDRPIRRLTRSLRDGQAWRDALHALVTFPLGVIGFVVTICWWATAVFGTTWYAWGWLVPSGQGNEDLPGLLGLGDRYLFRAAFHGVLGLVALFTLPLAVGAAASLRSLVADLLLVRPARHHQQVDTLIEGRAAARAAEDSALRRLERDIHDGPQQRLVRLSIDLGRAEQKVGDASPELAGAISDAKRQTQEALDELRALSRGIAPPVLADRGLASALEEMAVRSAIPASCRIELERPRFPAHVETATYFLVAEALTNAAKHSGAEFISVVVEQGAGDLFVQVLDDGVGGAVVTRGHGLAGLEQRIRAADGRLDIDSPPGGPTTIAAEIPCGS